MPNEFSDRLQRYRNLHGLSQKDFSRQLGVAQGTVSQWETSKQKPDRGAIESLARQLGCSEQELRADIAAQFPEEGSSFQWLDEKQYTAMQQDFIHNVGVYNLDVCFIGPDTLHLPDSEALRDTWIANISAGVTYRVIWFLDFMLDGTFQYLGQALREVGNRVPQEKRCKGCIIHYATYAGSKDDAFTSNTEDYKSLANELKDSGNQFVFLENYEEENTIRLSLVKFWNSFSSITVVAPHETSRKAMASLTLRHVLPTVNGPESDTWLFFNRKQVFELAKTMKSIRDLKLPNPSE